MSEEFQKACDEVMKLKTAPTDEEKLNIYAHYKQATIGDCNTKKPGITDVKNKVKWYGWDSLRGKMTKEEAQTTYIKIVEDLKTKYGVNHDLDNIRIVPGKFAKMQ